MKTEAQLRRRIDETGDKLFYWVAEYELELDWFETRKGQSLKDKYGTDNVADKVEKSGIKIYEIDTLEDKRKEVTRKAIRRLRYLERKIAECNGEFIMDKQQAMMTILDELHNSAFNPCDFDSDALNTALGIFAEVIDEKFYYHDEAELAAAIEYFGGNDALTVDDFAVAFKKAFYTLERGCRDFTFDADINSFDDLGEVFFYKKTRAKYLDDLQDYVDFERLGEDVLNDTQGKFTRYGFFAPMEIF